MPGDMSDEVLFTVVGDQAKLATTVKIEDLGMTEPRHLEKWVITYPQTLGSDVLIVASQYDRFISPGGVEVRDRLDLLGLGTDGRLVVAELKRGKAPDTVELQAVKYAAMCSRFSIDQLAGLHSEFLDRTEHLKLTSEEATEKLQAHAADVELSAETFLRPRIVLLAESYPATVTTSVVWLAEQGVDITLRRYQAYKTAGGETILTVSQVYPLADVASFLVGPRWGPTPPRTPKELPEVEWSIDDFSKLISLGFPVPIAVLNACAEQPGRWVSSTTIFQRAAVPRHSGASQLAGFGYSVRTRFARSNHPWQTGWKAEGENVNYYKVDDATAERWLTALAAGTRANEHVSAESQSDEAERLGALPEVDILPRQSQTSTRQLPSNSKRISSARI
jgi:hypothetical protein